MKYSYLKITGDLVWATDTLTKEDLARLKQHSYDAVIDLEAFKQFDPNTNEWVDIKGE